MLRKLLVSIAALSLISLPLMAHAAQFRTDSDTNTTVSTRETVKNLYVANTNVTIDANTKGDLVAAGGSLLLNGNVENSLFAAGNDITVRGDVGQSARIAGSNITISQGHIGSDLMIAGNNITISKDVVIDGDLFAAGNQISVDGTVTGVTRLSGNNITINGRVGATTVYGQTLVIGSTANISQDVKYVGNTEAKVDSGAILAGTINYTKANNHRYGMWPGVFALWILALMILGVILLAMAIVRFLPRLTNTVAANIFTQPLASLGLGFVLVILVPILLIVLGVSIIGLPFAGLGLLVFILLMVLGSFIGRITFGGWVLKIVHLRSDDKPSVPGAITGIILTSLLMLIPFLGFLICAAVVLMGWGATLNYFLQSLRHQD